MGMIQKNIEERTRLQQKIAADLARKRDSKPLITKPDNLAKIHSSYDDPDVTVDVKHSNRKLWVGAGIALTMLIVGCIIMVVKF